VGRALVLGLALLGSTVPLVGAGKLAFVLGLTLALGWMLAGLAREEGWLATLVLVLATLVLVLG